MQNILCKPNGLSIEYFTLSYLFLSIYSPRLIRPLCIILFTADGSYTADFVIVAGAFLEAAGVGIGGLLVKIGGIEWFLRITAVPFGGAENFIVIDAVTWEGNLCGEGNGGRNTGLFVGVNGGFCGSN